MNIWTAGYEHLGGSVGRHDLAGRAARREDRLPALRQPADPYALNMPSKLSGNGVYCTNSLTLLVKNMLRSKFTTQLSGNRVDCQL